MKHNQEFLNQQRDNLLILQDRLLKISGQKPPTMEHADDMDLASSTTDLEFALATLSSSRTALLDIQNALEKLKAETYGVCEMSGELIKPERLEAIPFARFTVECQAQIEKENRHTQFRAPQFSLVDEPQDSEEDDEEKEP